MNYTQAIVGILLCCLLFLALPGLGSIGSVTESPDSGTELSSSDAALIDDALGDADGTVSLIISFEDAETVAFQHSDGAVGTLKATATESQQPLAAFASERSGVTVDRQFWLTNAASVTVDTDRVALAELTQVEGIAAIKPNFKVQALGTHSSAAVDTPSPIGVGTHSSAGSLSSHEPETTYGVGMIRAPEVWDTYETKGAGTSVAVIDTGIDPDHPDINLTKWAAFDENGDQNESSVSEARDFDSTGHGTHASGTVAGGNASGEYIGVAPETELHHGAALTNCTNSCSGTFAQIIGAMEWGVENEVDVLSMSLGAPGYFESLVEPVQNAHDAGTTVVAAIGNSGEDTSSSPGNVYDAISVGAVDESEDVASFSGGELIDSEEDWDWGLLGSPPDNWPDEYVVPAVSAPGVSINSAMPGGGYGLKQGTSMATPHVAGAVALMQAATDTHLSPATINETLESTATKPDGAPEPAGERDTRYGSGIIDAMAALESVAQLPEPVTASFVFDPEEPDAYEEITFNASASDGPIDSYEWDLTGDGETDDTGELITYSFSDAGEYNVTLSVASEAGETDNTTQTVSVAEPPGPIASFTVDPSSPQVNESATFNASDSFGDIESYEWEFGDGFVFNETGEGKVVTHNYSNTGSVDVTLTVTDDENETDTKVRPIYVGLEALTNETNRPQDVTGDGLYRDLNGDGEFTIADVQLLFEHYERPAMQEHIPAYDFTGFGDVSIFDVQQLFNELQASG